MAILIGCLLFPVGALAEEPGERAAAEVLFEAGRDAMAAGDYDEACAKFEASMDLDPAPGTLMNLGNCEEKRGNIASAWERYVAAQRDMASTDRRYEFAAEKAKELEAQVPRLTITVAAGAPEGTRVRRADIDLTGSVGIALPLDPGSYQITASADGFDDRNFDVTIALGETLTLEVAPGDKLPEPVKPQEPVVPPQTPDPMNRRTLAYVIGGVGATGIAVALTTGTLAYFEDQTMDEECDPDTKLCTPAGIDARDRGETYAMVSNIAAAVGVIGLGTGLYLYLTSDEATAEPTPRSSGDVKFEAGSFAGYHGLRLSGQF